MIYLQECKYGKNEKKMYRVLEDKQLIRPIYAKIYPELHSEIKAQYDTSEKHWYYLSDTAYEQYEQHLYGFVTYAPKPERRITHENPCK